MSLIPFILDLADELNEINRNMVSGMDVDDFGFGVYPHEVHQASPRWPRAVSQFYLLPSTRGRHHPYWRSVGSSGGGGGGGSRSCCHRALVDKESAAVNDRESAAKPAAAAFAVINRNGFQVSMNVKQFSPNDLTVKTIDNCIVVEGQHDEKEDGHGVISRHFVRKYVLPKGFDPNEVLSTLSSDGILTVKAPPPTKAEEKLERLVHIQQTGPAQLSAKDAACGAATNKDKLQTLQTTATTTTQTSPSIQQPGAELEQQQQQEKSQRQQQQQQQQQEQEQSKQQGQQQNEEKKINVINEHNGDANANEINSDQGSTAATDTSSTSSMEPVVLVSNMVDPAAINAIIVTASAAAATANAAAGESDTKPSVADIPMVDVAVPDGVIESIVLVAASAAGIDGVGAVGIGGNEPAESVVNSVVTPTVGDLVAAADAAILLAKTQCENGNKTATGEEVAN